MLVQRVMGWRLRHMKAYHINELMDQTNAFMCVDRELALEAAAQIVDADDLPLVREHINNPIVRIKGMDEEVFCEPQHGGLMGTSFFPRVLHEPFIF